MKYLYIISGFVISVFFISCEKEESINPTTINIGASSEPCTLNCSEWEECATRLINPNDWLGPTEWYCKNILDKFRNSGRYEVMQTITDNNGYSVSEHNHIYAGYPSENKLNLSQTEPNDDILITFHNSELFYISQSIYVTQLNDHVYCEGEGSFIKNGSSPSYTLEINVTYNYNDIDYNLNITGSNQYGYHP